MAPTPAPIYIYNRCKPENSMSPNTQQGKGGYLK